MSLFRAAFAAAALASACLPATSAEPLRLDAAFARVIAHHPELAVLEVRAAGLAAERERAAQQPTLNVGASIENALGSGAAATFDGAEMTLSLSSVFERGGKRAARIAVAERRIDASALLREAKQIDLLAEVARRYLDVVAAHTQAGIAGDDLKRREQTEAAAEQRVAAGGAPISVQLAARAAKQRAAGERARAMRAEATAKRKLALMWAGDADFEIINGQLASLPAVADLDELMRLLERNPELRVFAHESRVHEARLQLARSNRVSDIEWQVGVRRLQAGSDWALVGSVTLPLGAGSRGRPDIDAVNSEIDAITFERDGTQRTLAAALTEAWGQMDAAVATARMLDEALIPTLIEAEQSAEGAYRRGALTYLEWAQLQDETTQARRERLAASLDAHRALIELQRLTGTSLAPSATTTQETPR